MIEKFKTTNNNKMCSKSLIYIDMFYPFDEKGETFLATEIENLMNINHKNVNKIIFPIWANREKKKTFDLDGFKVIDSVSSYSKTLKIIWSLLALFDLSFYKEIAVLIISRRLSLRNIIKLLGFIAQGNYLASKLEKYIKKTVTLGSEITFYSYWLHLGAYVAVKVSKKTQNKYRIKSISRCHRFDVYEYAANGYIPCRNYILNGLDVVYPISFDAFQYLSEKYGIDKTKLKISRLGTIDNGLRISPKKQSLKILSCSWMRPVKRNNLILEAIKKLDFDVVWTHIGDGEEFEIIEKEIKSLNKGNIRCNLLGRLNNSEVIKYYKENDFNIFVNVSSSEGVPVSIMEAMSFGKIIIATDVGGTNEIVVSGRNGFLMPVKLSSEELSKKLKFVYEMNEQKYMEMCQESRNIWEELCNAEGNYRKFNMELLG